MKKYKYLYVTKDKVFNHSRTFLVELSVFNKLENNNFSFFGKYIVEYFTKKGNNHPNMKLFNYFQKYFYSFEFYTTSEVFELSFDEEIMYIGKRSSLYDLGINKSDIKVFSDRLVLDYDNCLLHNVKLSEVMDDIDENTNLSDMYLIIKEYISKTALFDKHKNYFKPIINIQDIIGKGLFKESNIYKIFLTNQIGNIQNFQILFKFEMLKDINFFKEIVKKTKLYNNKLFDDATLNITQLTRCGISGNSRKNKVGDKFFLSKRSAILYGNTLKLEPLNYELTKNKIFYHWGNSGGQFLYINKFVTEILKIKDSLVNIDNFNQFYQSKMNNITYFKNKRIQTGITYENESYNIGLGVINYLIKSMKNNSYINELIGKNNQLSLSQIVSLYYGVAGKDLNIKLTQIAKDDLYNLVDIKCRNKSIITRTIAGIIQTNIGTTQGYTIIGNLEKLLGNIDLQYIKTLQKNCNTQIIYDYLKSYENDFVKLYTVHKNDLYKMIRLYENTIVKNKIYDWDSYVTQYFKKNYIEGNRYECIRKCKQILYNNGFTNDNTNLLDIATRNPYIQRCLDDFEDNP